MDRVYLDAPAEAHIVDGASAIKALQLGLPDAAPTGRASADEWLPRQVLKLGFPDAVVWNIGERAAGGIKDLAPGEWRATLPPARRAREREARPCGTCRV